MADIISSILAIITLVFVFALNKGERFSWVRFIIGVIGAWMIFYFGNLLGDYLGHKIHFTIPFYNRIPEPLKNWVGAILFFIGCCALSIKSWMHFNEQKRKKDSKSS